MSSTRQLELLAAYSQIQAALDAIYQAARGLREAAIPEHADTVMAVYDALAIASTGLLATASKEGPLAAPASAGAWVIRFPSGSYLQTIPRKGGGAMFCLRAKEAMLFASAADANRLVSAHEWLQNEGANAVALEDCP